ncbi:hypothetical protein [Novacetimonas maltaceti]|nr:hypothetical protein [Novacetimonas maltaceti]
MIPSPLPPFNPATRMAADMAGHVMRHAVTRAGVQSGTLTLRQDSPSPA